MSHVAIENTRLRKAREDAGFRTASEFAKKYGLTESLVRSNENGHRPLTMVQAKIYAKHLGVSWLYLMGEVDNTQKINAQKTTTPPVPRKPFPRSNSSVTNDSPDQLKVLGMGEGGQDGWAPFNGQEVETIARPDNLRGVAGAYAVYVKGDSMAPRYEPGEIVHVHPGKPVLRGSYVLVQRNNPADESQPLAIIKRLVRQSGSKVTLGQLNPKKEFDVPAGDIVSIHKIVGSSEA